MARGLIGRTEHWPLKRPFRISRGEKTAADVVVVEASERGAVGIAECVPYPRHNESPESVLAQIATAHAAFARGAGRDDLQSALPWGAARNAVDCALWDLDAKRTGRSVADVLEIPEPGPMATAVTVSLDTPERMAAEAEALSHLPLLKVKVNADDPVALVEAVRGAAPSALLIVDPNESWTPKLLRTVMHDLERLDVALVEQPIAAKFDDFLEDFTPSVAICADEAARLTEDMARIARRYQAVNIKLDKSGGLTEALSMFGAARELDLEVMIGCMVCTSLAVQPALLLAQGADFVDLDGPWWLKEDREEAVSIEDGILTPPDGGWGKPA